jgi:hypothetical protein
MSAAELNALEREVELTRARFANDLARLRSPHNIARFKEELWAQARDTREGVLGDLKARAAANPLAVAALAAGVFTGLLSQRCSLAWAWSACCAPPPRRRTTPTPKKSLIPRNGVHARAPLRTPPKKRCRIGAPRRARLRRTPRRRLRRPLHRWRTAPPMRCVMLARPRGIDCRMRATRHAIDGGMPAIRRGLGSPGFRTMRRPSRIGPRRGCTPPCPIATTAIMFSWPQPRLQLQPLSGSRSSGGHKRITDHSGNGTSVASGRSTRRSCNG